MSGFGDVRIPATRTGSGIRRVVLPSGAERTGVRNPTGAVRGEGGAVAVQRMRRHVTKGTYDDWPNATPESDVVEIDDVLDIQVSSNFITVIEAVTWDTGWTRPFGPPTSAGQILIISVKSTFSTPPGGPPSTGIYDTSAGTGVHRPFIYNEAEHTSVSMLDPGENVSFVAIKSGTTVHWSVFDFSGVTFTL